VALAKRGRTLDGLSSVDEGDDQALLVCYDAAARTPKTRLVDPRRLRSDERVAVVAGFNVHAGAAIDGRDRKRVERVCRYLARPPIATERLTEVDDGLRYELKKVWRDGTMFVTLDPSGADDTRSDFASARFRGLARRLRAGHSPQRRIAWIQVWYNIAA
jgi:hypothetical protein